VHKKLKNELTDEKAASFALAWAFAWRIVLAFILLSFPLDFVRRVTPEDYVWIFVIGEVIVGISLVWLIVHHVLKRGFGKVKVIIMEESHYEELVENNTDQAQL
jgi:cytochrome c biogenesis protein CcdA